MDLKWTPPKKDNGSEIASYIIEKRDKYGCIYFLNTLTILAYFLKYILN